jgi:hypothetical protein
MQLGGRGVVEDDNTRSVPRHLSARRIGTFVSDDAEARYAFACKRLELLRSEWEEAGRPFVQMGSRGIGVEHPLHKVLRLQEVVVDRLAARARPGRAGRPPSAVPGIPPPLEVVK